ncbi:MAG: HAMP domain-containing sensor histidine kinase [Bacteroidia bacterium]|jgi:two-component system phosphate regulon sensor histidine kinase PhoR|nr:HAMP domain-containing sensor histidine kinase [Bacteroidia bacterium]
MRVKVLIILVIVYILAAFAWLTFSLLSYSNTDYALKTDVLQAGLSACTLQVMQQAKNGDLGETDTVEHYLKQLLLNVEETQLQRFVHERFNNMYRAEFIDVAPKKRVVQLRINPESLEQLKTDQNRQQKIWLYQSILLLILVAAGIYGVYYSVDSIYKLNKRQNNFLLSVTHEFKTPIASIRLMLQTSRHPKINNDKRAELVENSIQNTYRLEDLAENMLTAMHIENEEYSYQLSDMDLSQMVTDVISNQGIKGEINAQIEPGISIIGDGFIWRMVVNNLIENAFKYSNNQPIDVELFRKGGVKILKVKDRGIGIRKEDMKKIFNKFYRVQDEETRTTKGTGLGLFIVKQTVQKQNGKIHVSANKPKGTIFTLKLP